MPFISAGDGDLKSAFVTDAWLIDQFVGNRLFTWGSNSYGQLGDATTIPKSSPVQTIARGINWSQLSCGYGHVAAIKTDGTLWTWGYNDNGQLGDNTTVNKSSPVQTIAGGNNWKFVACGTGHTAAIKTNGTLWLWGKNNYAMLGDNTIIAKSSPVQTVSAGNNWKFVACSNYHTAALKTDGTLWLWGFNGFGGLGDNTTVNKSSPVQTIVGGTNWASISCGVYKTAGIKTDGTLWTWGYNQFGQLGDNTIVAKSSPVQTIVGGNNWKTVSFKGTNTAAIKTDNTLWVWGWNLNGSLGDNTSIAKSSPVQTVSAGNNWKFVACSNYHTAALKTDGTLWLWGFNGFGGLGDNTTVNKSSPIQTIARGSNWKLVDLGRYFTAAVTYGD